MAMDFSDITKQMLGEAVLGISPEKMQHFVGLSAITQKLAGGSDDRIDKVMLRWERTKSELIAEGVKPTSDRWKNAEKRYEAQLSAWSGNVVNTLGQSEKMLGKITE